MTDTKSIYRSFCQNHQVPLFHEAYWWDAVTDDWDVAMGRVDKDYIFFPFSIERKLHFRLIRNPHLTPYSGFIFSGNFSPQLEEVLLLDLFKHLPECDYLNIDLRPEYQNNFPLPFNIQQKRTNLLTLRDPLEIFKDFKPSLQRQIRKAERNALKCRPAKHMDEFYQLYEKTFLKQKRKPSVEMLIFEKVGKLIQEKNCGQILVIEDQQQQLHAAMILVYDHERAYYLSGGSDPQFYTQGGMSFLLWEAIQISCKLEKKYFDFEGSMIPQIDRFFKNFKGEEVSYRSIEKMNSGLFQTLQKIKNWMPHL